MANISRQTKNGWDYPVCIFYQKEEKFLELTTQVSLNDMISASVDTQGKDGGGHSWNRRGVGARNSRNMGTIGIRCLWNVFAG